MAEREVIRITNDAERKALEDKLKAEGYFPKDEYDDTTTFKHLDKEAEENAKKIPGYDKLPWQEQASLEMSEKEKLIEKYYPGYLIDPNMNNQ